MKKVKFVGLLVVAIFGSSHALASETTTYEYDAKGRLVKVTRQSSSGSETTATYAHDKADNRVNVTVQTPVKVVVLPLNGFTVIPIN